MILKCTQRLNFKILQHGCKQVKYRESCVKSTILVHVLFRKIRFYMYIQHSDIMIIRNMRTQIEYKPETMLNTKISEQQNENNKKKVLPTRRSIPRPRDQTSRVPRSVLNRLSQLVLVMNATLNDYKRNYVSDCL